MNSDWQDSISPFLTTNSNIQPTSEIKLDNPLKIDSSNFFISPSHKSTNVFKPIPLPDDILGFENIPSQAPTTTAPSYSAPIYHAQNSSFHIENYLKSDINEGIVEIDDDFLDANLALNLGMNQINNMNLNMDVNLNPNLNPNMNMNMRVNTNINTDMNMDILNFYASPSKDEDLEKVLLDLGIAEVPLQQQSKEPNQSNTHSHKRKLSGSGIFGFVGVGENTQLSISGIPTIPLVDKKPLYRDITNFDNINLISNNYKQLNTDIQLKTPSKTENKIPSNSDYYISSGHQKSYKFPPSPPKGSFEIGNNNNKNNNNMNEIIDITEKSYSSQDLQSVHNYPKSRPKKGIKIKQYQDCIQNANTETKNYSNIFTSSKKSPLPTPVPTSPLNSIAMSSPIKDVFQTPKFGSPSKLQSKLLLQSQFQSQYNLNNNKTKGFEDTTMTDDDKDRTISAFTTPLKLKSTVDLLQTPSRQKSPVNISWHAATLMKKNPLTEKILQEQKPSPIRKKPTITSTLATGTLDKYFDGPDDKGKFICKFFDKEIHGNCNREFTRISNVRAHVQTHLSDRPFVCDQCGKAFVRNHDLKRHKKGHSEFSNICPCGKRFPRADALKRHRLRNICLGGISSTNGVSKLPNNKSENIYKSLNDKIKDNEKVSKVILETLDNNSQHLVTPEIKSQPHLHAHLQSQSKSKSKSVLKSQSQSQSQPQMQVQMQMQMPVPMQIRPEAQSGSSNDLGLFDFNEITGVGGNFSFNMDDSIVI